MQQLTQGYKLQQLLLVGVLWKPYIHIPHVESGQHEAMLFTVRLNPQIILISATIANKTNDPPNLQ